MKPSIFFYKNCKKKNIEIFSFSSNPSSNPSQSKYFWEKLISARFTGWAGNKVYQFDLQGGQGIKYISARFARWTGNKVYQIDLQGGQGIKYISSIYRVGRK